MVNKIYLPFLGGEQNEKQNKKKQTTDTVKLNNTSSSQPKD